MIRILGGQAGATPEAIATPAPNAPPYPEPPPVPAARWEPEPRNVPLPARPPASRSPQAWPSAPLMEDEDDSRTIANIGVDFALLRIPEHSHIIEIFDANGQWRTWGPIPAAGLNVGRSSNSADFPALSSLAVKHMRFRYDGGSLVVEDLGSLNGVAVKLTAPAELADGQRFRVGNQVLEFHEPEPDEPAEPMHSDDGEAFCSEDVHPIGYLDVIRPSNRPGVRFPITKHDTTVIGRKGEKVAIALSGDDYSISSRHALLRLADGKLFLEDLNSRNGTFVHVVGSRVVQAGDILLAGRVLFRIGDRKAL